MRIPTWTVQKLKPKANYGRHSGNALMEYVVPAAVILLGAGLLMTITDVTNLMADFFLSASGRSSSSLSGTTLKTTGLDENSFGNVDNGMSGFTSFGSQAPNAGTPGSQLYIGAVTRSGARQSATDTEYLFP